MSWKIVPDSAADVRKSDFVPDEEILIEEVPLTITVGNKDFIDDEELDTGVLIEEMYNESSASTTSCPSPAKFEEAFMEGDNVIAVTLSHKLSGSYNAAELAKRTVHEKFPEKNIHVVDSLSTCGQELLIVEKANELIKEGKSFPEVVDDLEQYRDSLETLFILSSYDNLIKNGRLNRFAGFIAKKLNIRIVGEGDNGELKILHKVRGEAKAIAKLVEEMGKMKNLDGANVVIAEVQNKPAAIAMMHLMEKKYPQINSINIIEAGGLNTYYAEKGGIIVSF